MYALDTLRIVWIYARRISHVGVYGGSEKATGHTITADVTILVTVV